MPSAAPARFARHLLEIADLESEELAALLDLAAVMKHHPSAWRHSLEGRTVACILHAPALSAHVALATAINRLGGLPAIVEPGGLPEDDARLLSRSCDAIVVHAATHRHVRELAEHASVPVVNTGSRDHDVGRALACCLALRERFGTLEALAIAYVGPAGPLVHSLLQAAPLARFELRLGCPPHGLPDPWMIASAGRRVRVFDDPRAAADGAHAVLREAEPVADLVPVTQALLHALITGDWEDTRC